MVKMKERKFIVVRNWEESGKQVYRSYIIGSLFGTKKEAKNHIAFLKAHRTKNPKKVSFKIFKEVNEYFL